MNFNKLYNIHKEYRNCTQCSLSKNRILNSEEVVIGQGVTTASAMLIVEKPIYTSAGNILDSTSEEYIILSKIFQKLDISIYSWYFTSAVSCKGDTITEEHVEKCQLRLWNQVHIIQPKIIVLSGELAYYAYLGYYPYEYDTRTKGILYNMKNGPNILYTHNLTGYIEAKKANNPIHSTLADEIMNHWETVKTFLDSTKEQNV